MNSIQEIIADTAHRPWELPAGRWKYYQEWNRALFLHWEVPYELLRNHVPDALPLDQFNGKYYVSLVAFTMQNIRPRNLPAIRAISDFHEINVRTYVERDQKKGVYFLNIEAGKKLSAYIARTLSGLPYEKSVITSSEGYYAARHTTKNFRLDIRFKTGEQLSHKTEMDRWLTERYCLYHERKNGILRYDIHHPEWEICDVTISRASIDYGVGGIHLTEDRPFIAHYSPEKYWPGRRCTCSFR